MQAPVEEWGGGSVMDGVLGVGVRGLGMGKGWCGKGDGGREGAGDRKGGRDKSGQRVYWFLFVVIKYPNNSNPQKEKFILG